MEVHHQQITFWKIANNLFKGLKQMINLVYPILHFKFHIEKLDISYKKYLDFGD